MALLSYDINLDQDADSTNYTWTLYAADRRTLIDLTGSTARMMIRALPSDPAPIVSLTSTLTSLGQLVLGGALGTVNLNITKAATALFGPQSSGSLSAKYIYDIYVDFTNGKSLAIAAGNVNVRLAITH